MLKKYGNFNSRSRVGSDVQASDLMFTAVKISIHAPVWGATPVTPTLIQELCLFQFTLPCGERRLSSFHFIDKLLFQFTLPCGERHEVIARIKAAIEFQFTLPCGERHNIDEDYVKFTQFQFTLPCGERLVWQITINNVKYISIHAPVWGATLSACLRKLFPEISIHAPVWGATKI